MGIPRFWFGYKWIQCFFKKKKRKIEKKSFDYGFFSKNESKNFLFSGFKKQCSLYIHIHLPILGVGKRFVLWLKLTIANTVTELSANNTICWFTKEITTKMKTNTFSIATFVARLLKSWKIWKITGKSWEKS